jgi:hypothetical protein
MLVLLAGCQCDSGNVRVYACALDSECSDGFFCGPLSHTCIKDGTVETDGGSAGGGAGGGGGGGGAAGGEAAGGGIGGGAAGGAAGGGSGGAAGGGAGGGTAGGGAGGAGGGASTLPPDRLIFTTAPPTIYVSGCSSAIVVATADVNSQPAPAVANTTVTFSSTGGAFYADPACSVPSTTANIASGNLTATTYFKAGVTGAFPLTASSAPLAAAMQTANVVAVPTSLAFMVPPPSPPLLAGNCFPATLQSRIVGAAAPVAGDTVVMLTSSPAANARFYSDATCATAITTVTILSGQSTAALYAKPMTGGATMLNATASFGSATESFTGISAVRRGTCFMSARVNYSDGGFTSGDTFAGCSVVPNHQVMASTMLVFTTSANGSEPPETNVRCKLNSVSQVQCRRQSDSNSVTIAWQTAELPQGLAVQRFGGNFCPDSGTLLALTPAVIPASTFVTSAFSSNGGIFDDEDMGTARLISGTEVRVDTDVNGSGVCDGYELQTIDLKGLTVMHGFEDAGLPPGATSLSVTGLPAASANTALLCQARTSIISPPDPTSLCNLFIRGDVTTPTSLTFTRGAGTNDGGCSVDPLTSVAWQRLDFGTRGSVQTQTVTVSGTTTDVPIAAVDLSRSLVFASGQIAGGMGSGETSFNSNGNNSIGVANARLELTSSTNVRVTRGRNFSTAVITFYVVELDP